MDVLSPLSAVGQEEAALLRAICEQPDEDTVRLAYADFLDEMGDELLTAHAALVLRGDLGDCGEQDLGGVLKQE